MKTSVEISGYTISIEENEGVISVNAIKEDEVVEEFTIQIEEGEEGDFESEEGEGVKPFGEFGDEEEDFEGESEEGEGEDDEESQDEFESDDDFEGEEEEDKAPEGALESFQSFINKKK